MSAGYSGIVLVDKPTGLSSFGVVARVRRVLSQAAGKKVKVGHTGTLDPFATGLLILVVGDWCKRAAEFSKLAKTYEATLRLGQVSSTGDPEGGITDISNRRPTREEIEAVLTQFKGVITQIPPAFSAIKIDGQRAYRLARQGQAVAMPERTVTIYSLQLVSYEYPVAALECQVSSGTYIRTLAEDIGRALGTGAYTTALRRTHVGGWGVAQAKPVEAITPADLRLPE